MEPESRALVSLSSLFYMQDLVTSLNINLFHCMIEPIMRYGSEVWCVANYSELDKFKFQCIFAAGH